MLLRFLTEDDRFFTAEIIVNTLDIPIASARTILIETFKVRIILFIYFFWSLGIQIVPRSATKVNCNSR